MAKQNEIPRSVAIVGRPNVGKSRLFNRLVGRRISIVHDMPGVTRDLITERVPVDDYLLMDTGGIGLFTEEATPKVIAEAVEEQVSFAIQAAELVIFVTDVSQGCTPLDHEVAVRLRGFGKKVLLAVNKVDNDERHNEQGEFFALGFGAPILISAEHNRGIEFLKRKILDEIGLAPCNDEDENGEKISVPAEPEPIRICLAGRPNVGKSSLGNALTKSSRLIVSDVAGTTRDPIRQRLDYVDKKTGTTTAFELIDTAGKRAKNKFDTLEYFSALRTDEAMRRADVCFLVIDALSGVTRLDKQLAGQIVETGTGLVVVVNKWDLALRHFRSGAGVVGGYENEEEFRRAFAKAVHRELFFLPGSALIFTSALEGLRVETMLKEAVALYGRMNTQIPTGQLNRVIHGVMEANPPKLVSGRRFKCYYAVQTGNKPLRVRLFCNSEEKIDETYERFLLAKFYEAFELGGVPVKFDFVGKPKQERTFFMAQQTETVGGTSTAKTRGNARIVPPSKKRTGAKFSGTKKNFATSRKNSTRPRKNASGTRSRKK